MIRICIEYSPRREIQIWRDEQQSGGQGDELIVTVPIDDDEVVQAHSDELKFMAGEDGESVVMFS